MQEGGKRVEPILPPRAQVQECTGSEEAEHEADQASRIVGPPGDQLETREGELHRAACGHRPVVGAQGKQHRSGENAQPMPSQYERDRGNNQQDEPPWRHHGHHGHHGRHGRHNPHGPTPARMAWM